MVTPVVSVRLHPELVILLDEDVEKGKFKDRVSGINAILASHYHVKKLPPVERAKPGRKSKGARSQ